MAAAEIPVSVVWSGQNFVEPCAIDAFGVGQTRVLAFSNRHQHRVPVGASAGVQVKADRITAITTKLLHDAAQREV